MQDATRFRQQRDGDDERARNCCALEQLAAQTAGRKRADEHIRVEEDSHDAFQETMANTSSSVRIPLASAYGIRRFRADSNLASHNCRRSASRAISLRDLFVSWPSSSSSRAICGSSRIVS